VTCLQSDASSPQRVGQPYKGGDRRAQDGATSAGSYDDTVAVEGGTHKPEIYLADPCGPRTEDDSAAARVVGDGVEEADLPVPDSTVDDLQSRKHEVDRA
jgi:hypothetical protein